MEKLTQKQLAEKVALTWRHLDTDILDSVLSADVRYSSAWVKAVMNDSDEYLEYLKGKFETVKKHDCKPKVYLILRSNGEYAVELKQKESSMLSVDTADGKVIAMRMQPMEDGAVRIKFYDDKDNIHGDHWDAITEKISGEYIKNVIAEEPTAVEKAKSWSYFGRFAEDEILRLVNTADGVGSMILLGIVEGSMQLVSCYPYSDIGRKVRLRITEIYEWENGIEAVIAADYEGLRDIYFFDADYILHKDDYIVGQEYDFELTAFAFGAKILEQRSFFIRGDKANEHRSHFGMEPQFEEDGTPTPVEIMMDKGQTYFPREWLDEAEFQSPIKSIDEISFMGEDLYKFDVAIARCEELDPEDLDIPLITRKAFFKEGEIKIDEPLVGNIWLQGRLAK